MTADDLITNAAALMEQIKAAAIAEVRECLGAEIARLAEDTSASRRNLREITNNPDFEASPEFLAGLRFAAQLVANPDFDY